MKSLQYVFLEFTGFVHHFQFSLNDLGFWGFGVLGFWGFGWFLYPLFGGFFFFSIFRRLEEDNKVSSSIL